MRAKDTNLNESLYKIVWNEGSSISQHSFQWLDHQIEHYRQLSHKLKTPTLWGLECLTIDKPALEKGEFILSNCRGVFKDGTIFNLYGRESLRLDVKDKNIRDIYLSFAPQKLAGDVAGYGEATHLTNSKSMGEMIDGQWLATPIKLKDCYDNLERRTRELLMFKQCLRLTHNQENTNGDTQYIKIAQLDRTGDVIHLNPEFIPVVLFTDASENLENYIENIINLLQEGSANIRQCFHIENDNDAIKTIIPPVQQRLLDNMISLEYDLRIERDTHYFRPQKLYSLLQHFIGKCGATSYARLPDMKYFPEKHTEQFTNVKKKLVGCIHTLNVLNNEHVHLQHEGQGIYLAQGLTDDMLHHQRLFITVKQTITDSQWINDFLHGTKVAASNVMSTLLKTALPGVAINYISVAPAKLNLTHGYACYEIEKTGSDWEAVVSAKALSIFVTDQFKHAEINLLALKDN